VLRGHRRAARLTLEQLAEVSGVSARPLSDMERGRSKGPQHRTVTALAGALALNGVAREEFVELARDGRLRDHGTRPVGLCELPRLVEDFTGRSAELVWMSELVYAESAPVPPILPPVDGLLFLDRDKFAAAFAADVPAKLAAFMADSQVPAGVDCLNGVVTEPAWRSKPSWYLVSTDDHMIPPAAQRAMSERAKATVTETPGSHAAYVSRPAVVAAVISQAAQGRSDQP